MNKKQLKEFLGAMYCALNCATENSRVITIMELCEKFGGTSHEKWTEYCKKRTSTFDNAMKDMKKLLKG